MKIKNRKKEAKSENEEKIEPEQQKKKREKKRNKSEDNNERDYFARIQKCNHRRLLDELRSIHSELVEQRRAEWFAAELIQMYGRCGSLEDARGVYESIRKPPPRLSQAMLLACIQNGDLLQCQRVFESMPEADLRAANTMISAFGKMKAIQQARNLFDRLLRRDDVSWSALLAAFTQSNQLLNAKKLFDRMPLQGVITATVMLNANAQVGNLREVWELFTSMKIRDVYCWGVMVSAFSRHSLATKVREVFDRMPQRSGVCWTSTVSALARNGDLDSALDLFQQMPEPGVVTYTSLITAHAQSGRSREALELFKQMDLEGIEPDQFTFSIVGDACAALSDVLEGQEIHRCAAESGILAGDVVVGNSILNMYGKCGCIDEAVSIFRSMRNRLVTTWNALISAYTENGLHRLALETFSDLNLQGDAEPDRITFTGVLTACSHTGRIEDAAGYFNCMRGDFGMIPNSDHYVSMSDMLARVGRLIEGEEVLHSMPYAPEAGAWLGLMGSCRTHLNADVAERAAEFVYEADPGCPSPYVLLSNIYAAVGRIKDVVRIRRLMKLRGVRNKHAVSFVQVKGRMLSFSAGGWSKSLYKRHCLESVGD